MARNARLKEKVTQGGWGTVEFAVLESGKVPAKDFFESMAPSAQASFLDTFQAMADYGVVPRKRFKRMGAQGTFRDVNLQVRFPCFRDGKSYILTHGFNKPGAKKGKGKWPKSELKKAGDIEKQYWERRKAIESSHERK